MDGLSLAGLFPHVTVCAAQLNLPQSACFYRNVRKNCLIKMYLLSSVEARYNKYRDTHTKPILGYLLLVLVLPGCFDELYKASLFPNRAVRHLSTDKARTQD